MEDAQLWDALMDGSFFWLRISEVANLRQTIRRFVQLGRVAFTIRIRKLRTGRKSQGAIRSPITTGPIIRPFRRLR